MLLVGVLRHDPAKMDHTIIGMAWSSMGIASGVLIWLRIAAGKYMGMVFALPLFFGFPIGTLIAWKIWHDLRCDETSEFFAGE